MCAICIRVSSSKVLVLIGLNGFFSYKNKIPKGTYSKHPPIKTNGAVQYAHLTFAIKKKGGNAAQANATSALKNGRIFSSSRFDVR